MLIRHGKLIHSAADLVAHAQCRYGLARSIDHALGRGPAVASAVDETAQRAAVLGQQYEQQVYAELQQRYPGRVRDLADDGPLTHQHLSECWQQTRSELDGAAAVLYQPTIYDGQFFGRPDFLISDGHGRWQLADAKFARSVRATALLQLAAYASRLLAAGAQLTDEVALLLGDGRRLQFRTADLAGVYTERARLLTEFVQDRQQGAPVRWGEVPGCGSCAECAAAIDAHRDLFLVAGMRSAQRDRLRAAGIVTIDQLAAAETVPPGTGPLQLQAQLQLCPGQVQVVEPAALAGLPAPDDGDVYFDFEGDPLWLDPHGPADGELGLEYLFGTTDNADTFRPWWAHNRAEEAVALRAFLDFVTARRAAYPGMHIYHYAAYERTALARLAARHGIGEAEVDDLLRAGVLVDLYTVVRQGLRVGVPSYSLKALEPLYMGEQLRTGEVVSAGASVVAYHEYCLALAEDPAAAPTILASIADYNAYDCRSTRGLLGWLRGLEQQLSSQPARDVVEDVAAAGPGAAEVTAEVTADAPAARPVPESEVLAAQLRARAGSAPRTPQNQAIALVAAALGYYWREEKPFWWRHFERLSASSQELAADVDVFAVTAATELNGWHRPPRARKPHRLLRLAGIQPDRPLSGSVFLIYDHATAAMSSAAGSARGWTTGAITAVEVEDGQDILTVSEAIGPGAEGMDVAPVALAPGPGPRTTGLHCAVAEVAAADLDGTMIGDLLARRPPQVMATVVAENYAQAIIDTLTHASGSYVAVQGPPGTGKTYTGAHVIAQLLQAGWRIGVVAQSHATVENLLEGVVRAGADPARVAKQPANSGQEVIWNPLPRTGYAAFLADGPGVVGGTAWDFVNANRIARGSLDLLVIDEAGQFSLADTIAVSVSAQRLLLLGDAQQLPGVTTGTHPEPVDISALSHLAAGQEMLPPEFGYFLRRTYRMHPQLCHAVSKHSYRDSLACHAEITGARQVVGLSGGVQLRLVPHTGHSQLSPPEAAATVELVRDLVGRTWQQGNNQRPLTAADILVVAPYNAQVHLLRQTLDRAGYTSTSVGTVDKFQGRQAPVVIVSMTASAADDAARGASFLFSRNRINVAISRAQYVAYLLRSPHLTDHLPTSAAAFTELGSFLGLTDP